MDMFNFRFILVVMGLSACAQVDTPATAGQAVFTSNVLTPPAIVVDRADTALHNNNGTWLYQGKVFSGFLLEKEKGKVLVKTPIIKGKAHGWEKGWYSSGKRSFEKFFLQGDREGAHRGWWENDSLRFENHFVHDKFEGRQASFYPNGKKWDERYYLHGYEEGTQRAWNMEGILVTNFTVKNGKVYGVIGRFDCMSIQSK